jgi:hypothetical protein
VTVEFHIWETALRTEKAKKKMENGSVKKNERIAKFV